jgi:hypothetical protein
MNHKLSLNRIIGAWLGLILLAGSGLHAQPAYQGGDADGYARAYLSNSMVSLENWASPGLEVYVSVGRHSLVVDYQTSQTSPMVLRLFDLQGRLLLQKQVLPGRNLFSLSHLSKGIYYLQAQNEAHSLNKKVSW